MKYIIETTENGVNEYGKGRVRGVYDRRLSRKEEQRKTKSCEVK